MRDSKKIKMEECDAPKRYKATVPIPAYVIFDLGITCLQLLMQMTLTGVLDLQAPASTSYEAFLVAMS